jgi:hypothetical protein
MHGLGLSTSAMQQGLVAPLDPNHTAVVAAARKLAKHAAVARAEKQVGRPRNTAAWAVTTTTAVLLLLWRCTPEAASLLVVQGLLLTAAFV